MVNGIDGVMGGTTTFDSMLAFMITGNGGLTFFTIVFAVIWALKVKKFKKKEERKAIKMSQETTNTTGVNRAKMYQLVLFPLNNGATNVTVLCMLYGCMMGNYDGLYLPMMILGYACSVPFFILTVRTSQKQGQKASLMKYVSVALVMKRYELTGPRMKEIQAINAARKEAIADGMSLEDAMEKWKTIDDIDKE